MALALQSPCQIHWISFKRKIHSLPKERIHLEWRIRHCWSPRNKFMSLINIIYKTWVFSCVLFSSVYVFVFVFLFQQLRENNGRNLLTSIYNHSTMSIPLLKVKNRFYVKRTFLKVHMNQPVTNQLNGIQMLRIK